MYLKQVKYFYRYPSNPLSILYINPLYIAIKKELI